MPTKTVNLTDIGTVRLYKRRGIKNIRISLNSDEYVRVSLPKWLPFQTGIDFVKSKEKWISENRRVKKLYVAGQLIGKNHQLYFETNDKSSTKVRSNKVLVYYPTTDFTSPEVQALAKIAIIRALRSEARELLPKRLEQLSNATGLNYNSVKVKQLKSRWGHCSANKDITLSLFLMQLPWDLIDYVLTHELIHTKVLNHGDDFWQELSKFYVDPKKARKALRQYRPSL